jgi:DNA-binding PadR family transcriptional regulator
MADEIRLTSNSYLIFSLLENMGEATPYALERAVADWDFWSLHHAQIYTEPKRLAKAGFLSERQEAEGRRRRRYKLTEQGRGALQAWLANPTTEADELRDLAILKIFLGADPRLLAESQLPAARDRLTTLEESLDTFGAEAPQGFRLVLEGGVGLERVMVRFWERLAEGGD